MKLCQIYWDRLPDFVHAHVYRLMLPKMQAKEEKKAKEQVKIFKYHKIYMIFIKV